MDLFAISGLFALGTLLSVIFVAAISRANRLEDDGPDTILIPPAEPDPEPDQEAIGDQVDVRGILKRYAGD